ncbi:MAG: response regulator [Bacteroidia bacterium]
MDNKSRNKVLLIEDSMGDIELFKEAIKTGEIDCDLEIIRNGSEAINFFKNEERNIADQLFLIVIDLNLPEISGHFIIKELRYNSKYYNIPINILSTSSAETDVNMALRNGANAYTTKSIDLEEFLDTIKTMLRFWKKFNSIP